MKTENTEVLCRVRRQTILANFINLLETSDTSKSCLKILGKQVKHFSEVSLPVSSKKDLGGFTGRKVI